MTYEKPEMAIIMFNCEDAVLTSNGMGNEDIGNGTQDDF